MIEIFLNFNSNSLKLWLRLSRTMTETYSSSGWELFMLWYVYLRASPTMFETFSSYDWDSLKIWLRLSQATDVNETFFSYEWAFLKLEMRISFVLWHVWLRFSQAMYEWHLLQRWMRPSPVMDETFSSDDQDFLNATHKN
jgi:hypothetical protein